MGGISSARRAYKPAAYTKLRSLARNLAAAITPVLFKTEAV